MRRRIGKTAVMIAVVVSMLLFVCCASEDTSAPGITDKGEREETVSENESALLPPEEETEAAQMSEGTDGEETGTAQMPEETGGGEMEEPAEGESIEESEDNTLIYYANDDRVWENDLFCTFLEGNATAYDSEQGEELTWPEYLGQHMGHYHGRLRGMQLAAEDLNGDGKEELMVMLDDIGTSTDLYVFHEENGKLYAWDTIELFYVLRGDDVILREGGIIEDFGSTGASSIAYYTWRFNESGEMEYIWDRSEEVEYFTGEDGKDYAQSTVSLYLYEEGECVRELINIWQKPEWQQDWSEAELIEGDEELEEVYSALLEELPEEINSFSLPEWADNAVEIPIWEAPGGQGWVSVENFRQFEYIGEDGTME